MSSSNSDDRATHVLVFPYPAQGHILPLLDLTHQLALRNLHITILITPKNRPTLTPLLDAHPSIQTLLLQFPSHPSIPPGVENVKELGNKGNLPVMIALSKLFDPIVQWFHSHSNPPVAILSDFFLGWTLNLARQLNIVRITFFSSGSFLTAVSDYCWNHTDAAKSSDVVEFRSLPRSPVFKAEHLPSTFRFYKISDPDWEFIKDGMIANTLSWGCVFNSFEALEGEYLDYLKRNMGHDRVFGVGPLSLIGPESTRGGDTGLGQNNHVLKWLDRCPNESVLYVCFGSQKVLRREQMEALASGLEKSGIRFLWAVKTSMTQNEEDGYGLVPDGFEERVADRGLVLKGWAPQVSILSHKAVGGFLSHCGWNSVLEALVEGVMILAWPMEADQFVNAKLLAEDLEVGVKACEGADTVPDSEVLGRVISESISQCERVKKRAKELRGKALEAVKKNGESGSDLDRLVQELRKLVKNLKFTNP
ncbi:UDP-glycosyltransferase [Melia azedarach]|uniref:UDP-glycosyltransferase n=1 Tax=Melia azedarach TaxID=155640 RepID=A0ACC1XHD2_MELAZ|nr:UDP-glycosyltransferase [Melia azedarach]